MDKQKVKELLQELLDNWLQAEQNLVDECSFGKNAIRAEKAIKKDRKKYEQEIKDLLNG